MVAKTRVACTVIMPGGEPCDGDIDVTLKLPRDEDEEPELVSYRAHCGHAHDAALEEQMVEDAFDRINLEREYDRG